eukprot:SAG22_NODE_7139_length_772_cov_0.885587_1_plen_162_part_10
MFNKWNQSGRLNEYCSEYGWQKRSSSSGHSMDRGELRPFDTPHRRTQPWQRGRRPGRTLGRLARSDFGKAGCISSGQSWWHFGPSGKFGVGMEIGQRRACANAPNRDPETFPARIEILKMTAVSQRLTGGRDSSELGHPPRGPHGPSPGSVRSAWCSWGLLA